jgi:hypothetical protein
MALPQSLRDTIAAEEPRLRAISEQSASAPAKPGVWTKKQELGHLVDSATNNRVRFIRGALENGFSGPSYDGDGWVAIGGYNEVTWASLIDLWKALNQALVRVVDNIPPERLSALCRVADAAPVTLQFLIEDYVLHMRHHLDHIVGREHLTEYPGAAIGV